MTRVCLHFHADNWHAGFCYLGKRSQQFLTRFCFRVRSLHDVLTVAYLGGHSAMPPLWPDHENFLQTTLYEKVCFFAIFQQALQNSTMSGGLLCFQISEKCGFHWTFRSKKCFSFRGASSPWPPDQRLCPWTLHGAPPPDPLYRLALRALAMAPLCQILNTPLHTEHTDVPTNIQTRSVLWPVSTVACFVAELFSDLF